MGYMIVNDLRRFKNRARPSGLRGVMWSGHERGDYDPADGIPTGMSRSDKADFAAEQAAAGLTWNGTAWVKAGAAAIPPEMVGMSIVPVAAAPQVQYAQPVQQAPIDYYYPPAQPSIAPSSANVYIDPATGQTFAAQSNGLPPQTIVTSDQVPASAAPATSGIEAVPVWAWLAGAAVVGFGIFSIAGRRK